jgi:hypothetical protein
MTTTAFSVDNDGDRSSASDGVSRYGYYLRAHSSRFRSDDSPTTDPTTFALEAFLVALPPVMSPGYVRTDPRVLEVGRRWDYEHRPAVTVTLVSALPPVVRAPRHDTWRPETDLTGHVVRWQEPYDYVRPILLPTLQVIIPLADADLPTPVYDRMGMPDLRTAQVAVWTITAHLNVRLASILDGLTEAGVA